MNRFFLWDNFGDGWGSSQFHLHDSRGKYITLAPTCTENPLVYEYCFVSGMALGAAKNGDYVTASIFGFSPTYPWEVCLTSNPIIINKLYNMCYYFLDSLASGE